MQINCEQMSIHMDILKSLGHMRHLTRLKKKLNQMKNQGSRRVSNFNVFKADDTIYQAVFIS